MATQGVRSAHGGLARTSAALPCGPLDFMAGSGECAPRGAQLQQRRGLRRQQRRERLRPALRAAPRALRAAARTAWPPGAAVASRIAPTARTRAGSLR